jgi:ABC-type lipoprotein export system ATPase subunit
MATAEALLNLQGVTKLYEGAPGAAPVLQGVDLQVEAGETLAIVGPSGCGKSTLLNLVGGLDKPTSGVIEFGGDDLSILSDKELAHFRNRAIGFVFQLHHLLPQCTVLENVLVPTLVNTQADQSRDRAKHLLDRVGLSHRVAYRPDQLSGGERQRVAVVRALINKPSLLLADEPTGSLSRDGSEDLAQLMLELNSEEGMALIVVTHSMAVAQKMGRVLELTDGVLGEYSGGDSDVPSRSS